MFKQKTAYEMRISDWSSDVCSSDLPGQEFAHDGIGIGVGGTRNRHHRGKFGIAQRRHRAEETGAEEREHHPRPGILRGFGGQDEKAGADDRADTKTRKLEVAAGPVGGVVSGGMEDRGGTVYEPKNTRVRRE